MKKKLIYLDIDNTLIDTEKVQKRLLQKRYDFSNNQELNDYFDKICLEEVFDLGKEMLRDLTIAKYFERIPHAYESLNSLKEKYIFECCTARPIEHSSLIDKIIFELYGDCINNIHYLDSLESKIDFCDNRGVFLLVDDLEKSFEGINKTNLRGVLYNNQDKKNSYLVNMKDWKEFPSILKEV